RTVLLSVIEDSTRLVDALEIIPEEDRLIVLGRQDASTLPTWNVAARVASLAASNPEAVALQSGQMMLSRAVVEVRASAIAQALRGLGVSTGSRVAVCVEDGAVRMLATLGVLKAGGAASLLDPADAAEYNEGLVATHAFAAVVMSRGCAMPLGEMAALGAVHLDDDGRPEGAENASGDAGPWQEIADTDTALMLHAPMTSPTPYGVGVTHSSLAALVACVGQRLSLDSEDVLVATLSPGTDAAAVELLLPLAVGARLVVASEDMVADGEALGQLLTESGATVGIATLATWRSLVASEWRGGPGFRAVISDGPVTGFDGDALLSVGCRVFVASSEAVAGMWFALHELTDPQGPALVGSTVGDIAAVVLDRQMQPAPIGVWGRLYLCGPLVRAVAVTPEVAEHVVSVTLDAKPVSLLDVGMEARRRHDGTLEHRGAAQTTTWIEGGRVALPIVGDVIAAHPGVADVSVRPALDQAGRTRLVAYVVLRPTADVTDSEIRALVRAQLPARMVPAVIVHLDRLPRDASGRIAAEELPVPFRTTVSAPIAPRSEAELRVAAAWTEMLGVPRVSVTDNFFSLGGYSLLCFRVIDRLQRETGIRLSPRSLLLGTLEQVAAALDRASVTVPGNGAETAAVGGTLSRMKSLFRSAK
ncbi:MAG: AMP-binding protein, partial [Gemmatimonadaceae bacterium]